MSSWEKPLIRPHQRRKTPSFSSSLLEAIYHSIDESKEEEKHEQVPNKKSNNEEEIVSLRRAILIEKWMESYKYTQSSGHFSSDSSSSTESSMFSSSETESRSINTLPRPTRQVRRSDKVVTFSTDTETTTTPKCEGGGRFMRTKSRALKMVKQPISPGGKIANFLNSIFNSRNMKKNHHEDWRKSRSVNDSTTSSCLNKTPSSASTSNKSKRSVRFCPVTVIVDEHCGHKSIYKNEEPKHQYRGFYKDEDEDEDDGRSCASSDLFELENIGMIGHVHATRDGLPVFGTTSFKMNQAIARGLVM